MGETEVAGGAGGVGLGWGRGSAILAAAATRATHLGASHGVGGHIHRVVGGSLDLIVRRLGGLVPGVHIAGAEDDGLLLNGLDRDGGDATWQLAQRGRHHAGRPLGLLLGACCHISWLSAHTREREGPEMRRTQPAVRAEVNTTARAVKLDYGPQSSFLYV